jgi:hypothetical protein
MCSVGGADFDLEIEKIELCPSCQSEDVVKS